MSQDLKQTATGIVRRLREAGHEAYFAGGCVRDYLRGVDPEDYDIATSAVPDRVETLFDKTVLVGKAFGVVRVIEEDHEIEVATFRTEGRYLDGRHPEWVRFAGPREDVMRRDLTINGMLQDPIDGRIIDHVGGREDLHNGVIRTIGDPRERFEEDKLRILRTVRFEAQLGFEIETETLHAVRAMAPEITTVSWERVRDELQKLLTSAGRASGLRRMIQVGLMDPILPEVLQMQGVPQPEAWHPEGDVLTHTLNALETLEAPRFEIALATLLHDIGKPPTMEMDGERPRFNQHEHKGADMAEEICRRLRLSNEQTERIIYIVRSHMKFKDVTQMRRSTLRRFLSEPGFDDLSKVHRADVLASTKDLSALEFIEKKMEEFKAEGLRPAPLLMGRDLVDLGLKPGPKFKEILDRVEDLQLEGKLSSRDEAIELVRKTWPDLF
jgi:poly(A) polymerase